VFAFSTFQVQKKAEKEKHEKQMRAKAEQEREDHEKKRKAHHVDVLETSAGHTVAVDLTHAKRSKPAPALTPFKAFCHAHPSKKQEDLLSEWKALPDTQKHTFVATVR